MSIQPTRGTPYGWYPHPQNPELLGYWNGKKWTGDTRPAATPGAPPTPGVPAAPVGILCPHCGTRGQVAVHDVKVKRGVSGGKATAAVLTAGVSLFATGLSRKQSARQLSCQACRMKWTVE